MALPPCRLLLVGLVASFWVSACLSTAPSALSPQAASNSDPCRVVEHQRGTTEVCGQPQRIAVLSPHTLDVVLALGAQPAAYAESVALDIERFDNPVQQIPHLGDRITTQPLNLGDRKSPSLERLALLKPDLIIGEDWLAGDLYRHLASIAPTLLFSDERSGSQHWRHSIQGIAKALGREDDIEQVNAEVSRELEAARRTLAPLVKTLPKMLILSVNSTMTDLAIAPDSTVGRLLEKIGFQLVFPEPTTTGASRWLHTSPEVLPTLEADIILVIGWDASEFYRPEIKLRKTWIKHPLFNEVPASKAHRVFFVDYQLWGSITRGPITDSLILKRLPEIFSSLLPT
jgi:iron complex transport system substrate-binding protein